MKKIYMKSRVANIKAALSKAQKSFSYYQLMLESYKPELDRAVLIQERDIASYSIKKLTTELQEAERLEKEMVEPVVKTKKAKPPKPVKKKKEKCTAIISFAMPPSLLVKVAEASIESNMSRGLWIRTIITKHFEGAEE